MRDKLNFNADKFLKDFVTIEAENRISEKTQEKDGLRSIREEKGSREAKTKGTFKEGKLNGQEEVIYYDDGEIKGKEDKKTRETR